MRFVTWNKFLKLYFVMIFVAIRARSHFTFIKKNFGVFQGIVVAKMCMLDLADFLIEELFHILGFLSVFVVFQIVLI